MILHLQKISLAAAIAALMSAFCPPALAGQPLTESESLRIGLARPELNDLARGRVGEAEADALEASLWANPTLDYSRDNSRNGTGIREETWQLSQLFDLSGRRGLRRAQSETEKQMQPPDDEACNDRKHASAQPNAKTLPRPRCSVHGTLS